MFNHDLIARALADYRAKPVEQDVSPNDLMNNQWYFEIGASAVEVIATAMMCSQVHKVERVLDLPCGHGRVLRHLVRMFPQAEFHACDLDTDGVAYCAQTFGATPMPSRPDLTEMDFGARYDLIWVGSLFTHVSEAQTAAWLAHLAKFLGPTGIIVATMHGRWSVKVNERSPYIGADRWREIMAGYEAGGYGYADYVQAESSQYVDSHYGISLARPHVMMRMLEAIEDVRIYSYIERAWADHQDVLVVGKPAYDTAWD